jgi:two-component system LytT family sensor kinase
MKRNLGGLSCILLLSRCQTGSVDASTLQQPKDWLLLSIVLIVVLLYLLWNYRKKIALIKREQARINELEKYQTTQVLHRLEMEKVINYFTRSIYNHHNEDELFWDITKNCISQLGFEDCVIYRVIEEKGTLIQKAAWGPKTTEENKILNPLEIPVGAGIVGHVAQTGRPEIIADTSLDSRYIVDDKLRFSEITVPIVQQGKVIGVMDCEHSKKNFYNDWHLQTLETIAALCADRLQKIKVEADIRDKELHLALLKENLAASQLTALRAQMNPHFIFNALNSVQQYILEGDVDQANRYLTKFSRLQREVLQHCDQPFISLEKEIEMLELYLQFEKLRFSENFDYSISIPDDVDPSEIKIPPMMLQPFVENAIWHGLMPKQGDKKLAIGFELKGQNDLHCYIEDNGIGITASQRLKQNNQGAREHQSKGMNLVKDRLKILEQQYDQPFRAEMEDISDETSHISGTRINLQIFIAD